MPHPSSTTHAKPRRKERLPTTLREAGGAVVGGGFLVPSVMEAQERERQAFITRQRKRAHADRERQRVAEQVGGAGSSGGGPAGGFADWAPEYEVVLDSDRAAARAEQAGASPGKPAVKSMESSTTATTAGVATPVKSLRLGGSTTATASRQASPRNVAPGSPRGDAGASPRPAKKTSSAAGFGSVPRNSPNANNTAVEVASSGHNNREFKLPQQERAKLQQMLEEEERQKAAAAAELDLARTVHPGQGHKAAERAARQLTAFFRRKPHAAAKLDSDDAEKLSELGVKLPATALVLAAQEQLSQRHRLQSSSAVTSLHGSPRDGDLQHLQEGPTSESAGGFTACQSAGLLTSVGSSGGLNASVVAERPRDVSEMANVDWAFDVPHDHDHDDDGVLTNPAPFPVEMDELLRRIGNGIAIPDAAVRERVAALVTRAEAAHVAEHVFWFVAAAFFARADAGVQIRAGRLQRCAGSLAKLTWAARGRRAAAYLPSCLAYATTMALYESFPGSRSRMSWRFHARSVSLAMTVLLGTDVSVSHARTVQARLFSDSPEVILPEPVPVDPPKSSSDPAPPPTAAAETLGSTMFGRRSTSSQGAGAHARVRDDQASLIGHSSTEVLNVFNEALLDPVYAREIVSRNERRLDAAKRGDLATVEAEASNGGAADRDAALRPDGTPALLLARPVMAEEDVLQLSPRVAEQRRRMALHYAVAGLAHFEGASVRQGKADVQERVLAVRSIYDVGLLGGADFDPAALEARADELREQKRRAKLEPAILRQRRDRRGNQQFMQFVAAKQAADAGGSGSSSPTTGHVTRSASSVWRGLLSTRSDPALPGELSVVCTDAADDDNEDDGAGEHFGAPFSPTRVSSMAKALTHDLSPSGRGASSRRFTGSIHMPGASRSSRQQHGYIGIPAVAEEGMSSEDGDSGAGNTSNLPTPWLRSTRSAVGVLKTDGGASSPTPSPGLRSVTFTRQPRPDSHGDQSVSSSLPAQVQAIRRRHRADDGVVAGLDADDGGPSSRREPVHRFLRDSNGGGSSAMGSGELATSSFAIDGDDFDEVNDDVVDALLAGQGDRVAEAAAAVTVEAVRQRNMHNGAGSRIALHEVARARKLEEARNARREEQRLEERRRQLNHDSAVDDDAAADGGDVLAPFLLSANAAGAFDSAASASSSGNRAAVPRNPQRLETSSSTAATPSSRRLARTRAATPGQAVSAPRSLLPKNFGAPGVTGPRASTPVVAPARGNNSSSWSLASTTADPQSAAVAASFSKTAEELFHDSASAQRVRPLAPQQVRLNDEAESFSRVIASSEARRAARLNGRTGNPASWDGPDSGNAGGAPPLLPQPTQTTRPSETVGAATTYTRTKLNVAALSPLAQSMAGTTSVGGAAMHGTVNLTHLVQPVEPNAAVRAAAVERMANHSEARRQAHSNIRARELEDHVRVLANANEQTMQRLDAIRANSLRVSDEANAIIRDAPPVRHPEPSRASHAPFLTGTIKATQAKSTSDQLALQFRKAEGRFTSGPLKRRHQRK